ncbi:MAG: PDZ domain-containing protein [Nitrospiraceae bacterium]|nr:MAG: PDZ domain-containing protein [Nitrospiraceae bacterium]
MKEMNFISRIIIAVLLLLPAYALAETDIPLNDLTVRFDLGRHVIAGVSKISLPAGQAARVNLAGLKLKAVSIRDRALVVEPGAASITFTPGAAEDVLKIEYEAEYPNVPDSDAAKNPGVASGNAVSPEGILLMDNWYPSVEGASLYRLKAILPSEFEGISEAEEVQVTGRSDGSREILFVFDHPLKNLTFIAGKYKVEKERHGEIEVCTYFFAEDNELSKTYREYTKKYLDMYEKYIGKYPFKRFAVVENFLPTGYSLPTFTLLGKDIVKLPFIVETSLGHEILHQWFGNLVYIDEKSGNWSEGLTTYLADHMYEELKEKGWDYRKQILISFQSYVADGKDFPLTSFRGRTDGASAAIGYGKSAMVFHMLRKTVGDEIFFSSLRRFVEKNSFKSASWVEVREAFEVGYGKKLDWFFRQWVDEKGAPELEIKDPELKYRGAKVGVSFTIVQKGKSYKLLLPIVLKLREGEVRKVFEIEKESTPLEIEADAEKTPVAVIIDDNYDLFRKLADGESPPVISQLLGDDKKIFVVPKGKEGLYDGISEFLKGEGFTEKEESGISYEDIRNSSLLIPGAGTSLTKTLLGKIEGKNADFYLVARRNPYNRKGVIVVIESSLPSEIAKYMQKVTHYGKYSTLTFDGNKNSAKTVDETERGIITDIAEDTPGVEIPRITDLSRVIEKVAGKDIIYVGELHDRFEHHRVQLQIIMELRKKYKKIAIGMEMFQKPFQQALDDYITGTTDEKTFLKKSEYFKRWGFDYNLYREILLYAREYKIPVIALNIRKEIVSKVSREGLQALTDEEMKEVPEYLNLSDMEYRERLRGFFESHAGLGERNFDFFYQAQVLWDESMAQNLDDFVRKNPDYKVVVLAGTGHMTFGSGIPKRSFRLNNRDYAVILNTGDIERDVADFVLFPAPVVLPESPKLGVLLKEENKKVIISQIAPDSIAGKAGLEENDVVISLDGVLVESVDDMRISLFFKKKGDEIAVKVSRKRFLLGPVEKDFKITL